MTEVYRMNDRQLGMRGEEVAAQYIRSQKHYKILCKNYRSRLGEIDLIAQDGSVIVFIEVKTRNSRQYGQPAEAVEKHKQHKITLTAKSYLSRYGLWHTPCRFDVIEVMLSSAGFRIHHIPHAFLSVE